MAAEPSVLPGHPATLRSDAGWAQRAARHLGLDEDAEQLGVEHSAPRLLVEDVQRSGVRTAFLYGRSAAVSASYTSEMAIIFDCTGMVSAGILRG